MTALAGLGVRQQRGRLLGRHRLPDAVAILRQRAVKAGDRDDGADQKEGDEIAHERSPVEERGHFERNLVGEVEPETLSGGTPVSGAAPRQREVLRTRRVMLFALVMRTPIGKRARKRAFNVIFDGDRFSHSYIYIMVLTEIEAWRVKRPLFSFQISIPKASVEQRSASPR
jgi:hypothetical protein